MKMDIFLWKKESARGNIRENATKWGQSKRKRTDLRRKTKGRCPKYRSVKSKWERWCWNRTAGIEKQKAITEKPKDKIKKQAYYTEKTKHKQARQVGFFPSPTPFEKYKPTFSQNFSTFRDFLPCFISNLPTPHKIHSILRAGHAPTRIYAPALSASLLFLPSPFTSPFNKLYISRLSVKANPAFTFTFTATIWKTTRCTTSVAKKRWRQKGETFTRNAQSINTLHQKGEEVKAKIEKYWTRARARKDNKEKALFLWTEEVATIIGAALKTYPVGAAVHEKSDIKSVDLINPCYICLILSQ